MPAISKLSEGQVLYKLETRTMGNTTLKTKYLATLTVVSVNRETSEITAIYCGAGTRPARTYHQNRLSTWKTTAPVRIGFDHWDRPIWEQPTKKTKAVSK